VLKLIFETGIEFKLFLLKMAPSGNLWANILATDKKLRSSAAIVLFYHQWAVSWVNVKGSVLMAHIKLTNSKEPICTLSASSYIIKFLSI